MSTIDEFEIEQELLVFLRNQNILTVAQRGVTTATDNFTASAGDTFVKVSNTNFKNVRNVTVQTVAQTHGTEYTVTYESDTASDIGKINFVTALSLNDVVAVQYDYGSTDRIYNDFPRVDLNISSYPRISAEIISKSSTEAGLGGQSQLSDLMFAVTVYENGKKGIDDKLKTIRTALQTGAKGFYNFGYIQPMNTGRIIHDPNRADKIDQKTDDYKIPFELEVNS